jgi:acetyl esterase/lipase
VRHHLEGLPPLCVLHGNADELSPFSQSVELAEELKRRRMPGDGIAFEFYGYDGLSHYFAQTADDATTCNCRSVAWQMFQDSVDCLRRWLESE